MSSPSLPLDPRAEEVFREYLARVEVGEPAEFEALCKANPALEHDLRELKHAAGVMSRLRPSATDRPLSERLKAKFGTDPGLTQSLDDEPRPDSGASSTLFERLRGAGTRGTRYRLLGEVARGGMGVILKIWDDELRRTLAMKVVLGRGDESKGDTPVVDPKTLGRFLEEAQVTGQLDHPGIVPVHELGLGADGRVYFTMRLVKGEDLRSIFDKVHTGEDGWNQVRALGVLLKVCEAMSYAHSKKVVHRDLKPANVMVGKFGEVYVMDWGLARVLGREDRHDLRIQSQPTTASVVKTERREKREETLDAPLVTMDGEIVGTPSFMSPEQAKGQLDKLGPHSDVYALGGMLYQLLTRQMPYVPAGGKVSQRMILDAVLQRAPDPIESLAPSTPAELVAICEKAMARDIARRYPTTSAFGDDLRAFLEGRVVRAYETGAWVEAKKWVQRNKALAGLLAAFMIVLLVTTPMLWSLLRKAEHATQLADASTRKAVAAQNVTLDVLGVYRALRRPDMINRRQRSVENLKGIEMRLSQTQLDDPGTEAEIHLALADLHMVDVYERQRLLVDLARPHPMRDSFIRARDQLQATITCLRACEPPRPDRLASALYYLSQMGLEALDPKVLTLEQSRDAIKEAIEIIKSVSSSGDERIVLMQGDLAFAAAMISSGTAFTDEELDWISGLAPGTPREEVRKGADELVAGMALTFRTLGLNAAVTLLRKGCASVESNASMRSFLASGMERASIVHRKRGQLEAAAVTLAYAEELAASRSTFDNYTWAATCRLADQLSETRQFDDAAKYYRQALTRAPLTPNAADKDVAELVKRCVEVHARANKARSLQDTLRTALPAIERSLGPNSQTATLLRQAIEDK